MRTSENPESPRMCEEEDQKCGSELVTQCVWAGSLFSLTLPDKV